MKHTLLLRAEKLSDSHDFPRPLISPDTRRGVFYKSRFDEIQEQQSRRVSASILREWREGWGKREGEEEIWLCRWCLYRAVEA